MSEETKTQPAVSRFELLVGAVTVVLLWLILGAVFVTMLFRPLDAGWVGDAGVVEAVLGFWLTMVVLG